MKRLLALTLALLLLSSTALAYSDAYGQEVWLRETPLQGNVTLHQNIYFSNYYQQLRRENYFVLSPDSSASVAVSVGRSVCDTVTATTAADLSQTQVVAAINGDFYDTATGFPLGLVISDGKLLSSSPQDYYAVGFRQDGTAQIGLPHLSVTAQSGGQSIDLVSLNKQRTTGGIALLTYDFYTDHTTGTKTDGISVLCRIVGGSSAIGQSLVLMAEQTVAGNQPITLQPNQVVLTADSATTDYKALPFLQSIASGQTITVSFTADEGWEQVQNAVGASELLVENGAPAENLSMTYAPRTAVGITADGQILLYTVDGRQTGYSMGASLRVLAQRLCELGCTTAVLLDGGGSTAALAATPEDAALHTVSSPSGGSLRKVSNHLFLTVTPNHYSYLSSLYLATSVPAVLVGHSVPLTACALDQTGATIPYYIPSLSASGGSIANGVFYAPDTAGEVTISAACAHLQTSLALSVTDTPDTLTLLADGTACTQLTLLPNDSVQLSVSATYNHLPLEIDLSDVAVTLEEAVGTVSPDGTLQIGYWEGETVLTLTCGSRTVEIPLIVDSHSPFVDTDGHWGSVYLSALYHKSILSGVAEADGLYAYPDRGVTRAEFAVLLARYLQLDSQSFADVEVPFADKADIPAWATEAITALYARGILTGSAQEGQLYCNPLSTLTRAEAVTMLYRLQILPAETADLTAFTDVAAVPTWALDGFTTMVAQGIISGSNGELSPFGTMTRAAICKVLSLL